MKKTGLLILTGTLLLLLVGYCVGTGFVRRTDVMLRDFSVSEDGTELTIQVDVASSAGFVRSFRDVGGGVKPHYLQFYATFGGLNSSLGAKQTFVLALSDTDTELWFARDGGGYELVLQKDAQTNSWKRP